MKTLSVVGRFTASLWAASKFHRCCSRAPMRWSSSGAICCGAFGRFWHKADTSRCLPTRLLSGAKRWHVESLNSKPHPKRGLWASNRPFRDGHHIGRSHSPVSWCHHMALGYRICGWAELRCARSVGLPLPLHIRSFRT